MRAFFFGGYDPSYPRHLILKKGLEKNGHQVIECRAPLGLKVWARYPLLLSAYLNRLPRVPSPDVLFVPEFCQKDVPLARLLTSLSAKKTVFDPLASRYETKILDWKRRPAGSLSAWWNHRIDRWAFRLADIILADTSVHKDYYVHEFGVRPDQIAVLPVGYDDELFYPVPSRGEEKERLFTVLFFGSFLPLHGVEVIIRAAGRVQKKDRDILFRLIGSGQTFPRARALAEEMDLKNVEFGNWVSQDDLPRIVGRTDLCLGIFGCTEKAERVVPHKVFQAMGMKKPVITMQSPAVMEFFTHREDIYLLSAPRPELLEVAVLELKAEAALRERIAGNAFRLVKEKYSTGPLGLRLIRILEGTIPPGSQG